MSLINLEEAGSQWTAGPMKSRVYVMLGSAADTGSIRPVMALPYAVFKCLWDSSSQASYKPEGPRKCKFPYLLQLRRRATW